MEIVFDIETSAFDFDTFSESQQEFILRYAEKEPDENVRELKREEAIRFLSLYPFTAKVIAIGMLDTESGKEFVLFDGGDEMDWNAEESGLKYKSLSEYEMLRLFWDYAKRSNRMISFNGRQFDIPFLMIRSAIHRIKPTRNLLRSRFNNSAHIDLLEEFTFHGLIKKFNLDFYCKSFGIESPKSHGVSGMDVKQLYDAGRFKEIAIYCGDDVKAQFELYKIWKEFLSFK